MRLIDADQWVEELKDCQEEYKDCNQWLINEIDSRHTVYTGDEDRTVRIVFSHEHQGSCHRCPSCGKLANIYNIYCPGCGKLISWKDPEERADVSSHSWFMLLQEQEKEKALNQKELSEMLYKKLCQLREYEAIGTVKECQAAMEKQKPQPPQIWGDGYDKEENIIYDMYDCPGCGRSYEIDDKYRHCPECGQAIDWRGLENL